MEKSNDRLILRALERSAAPAPSPDLAHRILERAAQEPARCRRRESRLLLFGAVMCAAGLVWFGICFFRMLPPATQVPAPEPLFEELGATLGQAICSVSGEQLLLWGYLAVLFLVFACTGEWLRRRRTIARR